MTILGFKIGFFDLHAILFSLALITYVSGVYKSQRNSFERYLALLNTLPREITKTRFGLQALQWCQRRQSSHLFRDYYFYSKSYFIVLIGLLGLFTGMGAHLAFFALDKNAPIVSYIFSGPFLIFNIQDAEDKYISLIFLAGSSAFLGSLFWALHRLTVRSNNNDIQPMTYMFFSYRILLSCIFSGIIAHAYLSYNYDLFKSCINSPSCLDTDMNFIAFLIIGGFTIGYRPFLWVDLLLDYVISFVKEKISQSKQLLARSEDLPEKGELTLITGLTNDRIERLKEMEIDNCGKLSRENPIVIWLNTNYSLMQIIDWVAQAYLCAMIPNKKLAQLRNYGIKDIIVYHKFCSTAKNSNTIKFINPNNGGIEEINFSVELLALHKESLDGDPTFIMLTEITDALMNNYSYTVLETSEPAREASSGDV